MDWVALYYVLLQLFSALATTLELAAIAIVLGVAIGVVLGMLHVWGGRAIRGALFVLVSLIRGIPLVVQVFAVFFVLPSIGIKFSGFTSAAIALTAFASFTVMEIVRGGIQAIPREQMQAALSLGFLYVGAMRTIVLPQAFRIVLPALVNQSVFMIKATSVVSLFGVGEFLFVAKENIERTLMSFEIMAFVWIVYTAICYPLTLLGRRWEARLQARGFTPVAAAVTP